ncbi:MAG TPA: SCO family protein, partial [Humisphaera sp.]
MTSTSQKILTRGLWALLLCGIVAVVAVKWVVPLVGPMLAAAPNPPDVMFPAATFEFTDQQGKPFSSAQLKGKPYVASFMFTKCNGVCPQMNLAIADLNQKLPAEFHFVSFTVDPENDTVDALKTYAANRGADPARWHFLTGDLEKLKAAALGMKVGNQDWPGSHSDRLILVDGDNNIRGTYHSKDADDVKRLVAEAKALVGKTGGP